MGQAAPRAAGPWDISEDAAAWARNGMKQNFPKTCAIVYAWDQRGIVALSACRRERTRDSAPFEVEVS